MSEGMSRKERFEAAKKAREKAEKEKGGYGSPASMPDFEYAVIGQDQCKVLRFVGESLEMRTNPTDPLLVERSLIRDDNDKYFTMIWHPDKDWPFRVLVRKLAKYKYEDKKKVYEYDGCEYLHRYLTNGKENPHVFETGMAANKFVLFNVIDRMDDWCTTNKHTKMLAWDMTEQEDKKFYTAGMTMGFYRELFDKKCTSIGTHFEDVDFVVRRFSTKTRPADDMYYQIMYDEEKRVIQTWSDKDKVDYYSFMKHDYLTKEEEAYERYNLEGIPFTSQPTPTGIIMSKLEKFIKGVDKKYDWNIWELMVEWKAKEVEAMKAHKAEEESTTHTSPVKETKHEEEADLPTDVEEKHVEKVSKVAKKKVEKKFELTEEMFDTFAGLEKLNDDQLATIIGVDMDEMKISFNIPDDAECGECQESFPSDWDVCPYCATEY